MQRAEVKDEYRISRALYVVEATLEYFVALSVAGVYLAKLTSAIGLSDSLTGILSAFVSLGCGFQLIAIFLANKRPVKRWVTLGHAVSQLMFMLVYFVPLFDGLGKTGKTVLFFVAMLSAQVIHNVIHAPKINWHMNLVDYDKRGRFTSTKEMISLVTGMLFTFGMGSMMDALEAAGNVRGAFVFGGVVVFTLAVSHTVTLIFTKEKPSAPVENTSTGKMLKSVLTDKTLFKIIVIEVLWSIANYATTSFMGTYQTKELGFSMTFASIIVAVASASRAIASRPMGRYADKHSYASALVICFAIEIVAFIFAALTTPQNGKITCVIHLALHAVGMAGINGSTINLVYDYIEPERRTAALAMQQTLSGTAGFVTATALAPFVTFMQARGNTLFGITVYAQQILATVSAIVTAFILVYVITVVRKIKKAGSELPVSI